MIKQFIMGYISCIGFGMIFNNKFKNTLIGSIAGAIGWLAYSICKQFGNGSVTSTFVGAFVIGLICEIFARKFKDATVVFLIPAILPLVPGAGVYFTMKDLIDGDSIAALAKGIETIGCASAIAIGALFASSLVVVVVKVRKGLSRT